MARWWLPLALFVAVSGWRGVEVVGDTGANNYFSGGTISFSFVDTGYSTKNTYTARVTVITGWVLGHGPCGPTCSYADVGKSTHNTRLQEITNANDPALFGNWSIESQSLAVGNPANKTLIIKTITDQVNQNIQGRITAVSTKLGWEQETAQVDIEIDPAFKYTDVILDGSNWRDFDLNDKPTSSMATGTGNIWEGYRLQSKIRAGIRNDTGMPNSSPLVLYQPIYRIQLNKVTSISLTPTDKDGDLVQCRKAGNIELEGIGEMPGVTVSKDCIVTVSAMTSDGFTDDSWGVVAIALEDRTRNFITMGDKHLVPYDLASLSSSLLDFMVWVVEDMAVPEFVSPTPASQHVYTVYAGSLLSIPLAAKPSDNSTLATTISSFHPVSLPAHNLTTSTLQPDTTRAADHVMLSSLDWRTSDSDIGDFIIQVVAVDSNGYESQARSYQIQVVGLMQEQGSRTDASPYFPFFPEPGTIHCGQGETCSIPIFAKPGTYGHVLSFIDIDVGQTQIPMTGGGTPESVTYQGIHTYRTDFHFTTNLVGNKTICFRAVDNVGLQAEKCLNVSIHPPNPCDENPCNRGTCLAHEGNYTCLCPNSKTGRNCDQWGDPCFAPSQFCENGGTCISRVNMAFSACICLPGYTGRHCETVTSHSTALNGGQVDLTKPHFLVPTTPNGSTIACETHKTCTLQIYFTRGGKLTISGNTPATTHTALHVLSPPTRLTHADESLLTITPSSTGQRDVCIHVSDGASSGVTDTVCYTIESSTSTGSLPQSVGPNGGNFNADTLPGGSTINCRTDVPCQLMVTTNSSHGACIPVQAKGDGGSSFQTMRSTRYHDICETDILIDPDFVNGNGPVCFEAALMLNGGGEQRCYHIEPVASPFTWSSHSLQDDAVLHACSGDNVTFSWVLVADSGITVFTQWYYAGRSTEMMAYSDNTHFAVLPTFSGRLWRTSGATVVLDHVIPADSGNYSVHITGHMSQLHQSWRRNRTVILEVDDPPEVENKALVARQLADAVYDSSRGHWSIELVCGTFLSRDQPALNVVWQIPTGRVAASSGYRDGQFTLLLSRPLQGGTYTCRYYTLGGCFTDSASVMVDSTTATQIIQRAETDYPGGANDNEITFYVKLGHDATVQQNHVIKLTDVVLNEGQGYNMATGLFTAPVSGMYSFVVFATSSSSAGGEQVALMVDNSPMYLGSVSRASLMVSDVSEVIHVTKGERVRVVCGSPRCHFQASLTHFTGSLVHPDP